MAKTWPQPERDADPVWYFNCGHPKCGRRVEAGQPGWWVPHYWMEDGSTAARTKVCAACKERYLQLLAREGVKLMPEGDKMLIKNAPVECPMCGGHLVVEVSDVCTVKAVRAVFERRVALKKDKQGHLALGTKPKVTKPKATRKKKTGKKK